MKLKSLTAIAISGWLSVTPLMWITQASAAEDDFSADQILADNSSSTNNGMGSAMGSDTQGSASATDGDSASSTDSSGGMSAGSGSGAGDDAAAGSPDTATGDDDY
ncbi:MAG: hypothetical protein A3F12_07935 [Gammaproteobacteria bacterium RIFCSPHIGHO2_12_FULL_38_14]|nr:MAG: hypothetical protein A3F12_07935 [Gammaproteobacteria bacterium RIFCSPHIGHO2_12_FULL_38_14]